MPSAHRASPSAGLPDQSVGLDPVPIVDALPPAPRSRLVALMDRRDFEPGATFMHEGDLTSFLAIIVRGRVALRLRVPERGPVTILTLDPGDIVGWSGIVSPYRATASATTLEPTELAIFDAETLRSMLATDAEVAQAFLPPVLETVAARVAATRDQLLDLFRGAAVDPW